ncbi:MAG: hypothetical protein FWC39_13290 [Bacteroidetes bacterium]|nr:hypothetical protein [Bacteroidota bacterium]
MKKLILSAAALFLAAMFVSAQTPKVTTQWESKYNKNLQKFNWFVDYLGEDANSYYILSGRKSGPMARNYGVEKYDKQTLQPTATKEFKKMWIEDIYRIGGDTYVRVYENPPQYFKVTQTPHYQLYKFNKAAMTFDVVMKAADINMENVVVSPDKSKLLFVVKEAAKKKDGGDTYKIVVSDDKFNKLWNKSLAQSSIKDYVISNDGTVYVASKSTNKETKEERFVITKVEKDTTQKFSVNMKNFMVHKIKIAPSANNKLLVFGFATDKTNENKTGACYFSMNEEFNKPENVQFKEIPLSLLNASSKKKRVNNRYDDFAFGTVLYGENGEVAVAAEETEVYSITKITTEKPAGGQGMAKTTKTTTRYQHNYDTYVFKVNGDKLAWVKRVPKNQKVGEDENKVTNKLADRMGYAMMLSSDNVVVFFNDNITTNMNVNETTEKVPMIERKDMNLVSVTIDANGKQTKQAVDLSALAKDKLQVEVQKIYPLSNGMALTHARQGKGAKIGIITIK